MSACARSCTGQAAPATAPALHPPRTSPTPAPPRAPGADPGVRRKRKQLGGNSGKNFTEGWVEFEDKVCVCWGRMRRLAPPRPSCLQSISAPVALI